MGLNEAARIYGVPKSTLKFRKDKPLNIKITMGPCLILGISLNLSPFHFLHFFSSFGFHINNQSLYVSVQ